MSIFDWFVGEHDSSTYWRGTSFCPPWWYRLGSWLWRCPSTGYSRGRSPGGSPHAGTRWSCSELETRRWKGCDAPAELTALACDSSSGYIQVLTCHPGAVFCQAVISWAVDALPISVKERRANETWKKSDRRRQRPKVEGHAYILSAQWRDISLLSGTELISIQELLTFFSSSKRSSLSDIPTAKIHFPVTCARTRALQSSYSTERYLKSNNAAS